MEFQPLIETLGSLKPEKVVGLRRGYADAVAKGVFNRKLVGEYFQRLRGVGEGEGLEPVGGEGWGGGFFGGGMGLKDYEVASLRGGGGAEGIGSDDNDSKVGGEERSDATRRDARGQTKRSDEVPTPTLHHRNPLRDSLRSPHRRCHRLGPRSRWRSLTLFP
jgi:hypothetical protein